MFWKKKVVALTGEQFFIETIAAAHESGDQRIELTYRLLLLAQDAEKIRVSMQSIVDNYSDGLSDLTQRACHLFPTPLAAEVVGLERSVIDTFEMVEGLADTAQDLVIKLSRQTQQ